MNIETEDSKLTIREGYKQTEVGIIPDDWEVKSLHEGVKLLSGHHVLAQYCNTDGNGFPYITGPADFQKGTIQHSKFTKYPTTICRADDILLTVKGSGVGTMVVSDAEYCISRQLMAIRVHSWDANFIYSLLVRDESSFISGATGLIPGLSRSDILNKEIVVPLLYEQKAIAEILSDVDTLFTSLNQLITKKLVIKQGTMQLLLTGKKRLAGFSGDWKEKTIGDVVSFSGGSQPPLSTFIRTPKLDYIRLIQIRDYKTDEFIVYIPESLAKKKCSKSDIMIGRYGPPILNTSS